MTGSPAFSVRGRLVLGGELVPGVLLIEGGRLARVARGEPDGPLPEPVVEAEIVAPGFIDLQVNGGFGVEVGDDPEAIRHLAACLPQTGVTSFLPTVISSPLPHYRAVVEAFEQARGATGARPLGLHLEGPLLSPRRHGAHPRDVIEAASPAVLDAVLGHDAVRLVTLAPEREGAMAWIRRLREDGVTVSLGHTDATYEQFEQGVDAGARMATHLFNAMAPFEHRAPNASGAALLDHRITTGLIADGVHVSPQAFELALRVKGSERVAMVTDMILPAGLGDGRYRMGERAIVVHDGMARVEGGPLAGSLATMDQMVRNVVAWTNRSVPEVIRMATEIPAGLLGWSGGGRLLEGLEADLVLLDGHLAVQATYVGGQLVYRRD